MAFIAVVPYTLELLRISFPQISVGTIIVITIAPGHVAMVR